MQRLYPQLVHFATELLQSTDVLRFMGYRVTKSGRPRLDFADEVVTTIKELVEGTCVKHRVAQNLLKKIPKGRCAALEILVTTPGIANCIRDAKTYQITSMMQVGGRTGMVLINDAALKLVMQGLVDPKEAYAKIVDKADFIEKLKVAGISLDLTGNDAAEIEPAKPPRPGR